MPWAVLVTCWMWPKTCRSKSPLFALIPLLTVNSGSTIDSILTVLYHIWLLLTADIKLVVRHWAIFWNVELILTICIFQHGLYRNITQFCLEDLVNCHIWLPKTSQDRHPSVLFLNKSEEGFVIWNHPTMHWKPLSTSYMLTACLG